MIINRDSSFPDYYQYSSGGPDQAQRSQLVICGIFPTFMVSVKEYPEINYGTGTVPWRVKTTVTPKKEFAEITLLEGMAWLPRRLCLLRDEDNLIRRVALQQGHNFRENNLWRDPHVAYRFNKNGEWSSIKPQNGRALWRDVSSLLADSENAHYRPPLTVSRAADVMELSGNPLMIRQVGVITNQASYISWVEDRLSVPEFCNSPSTSAPRMWG